MNGHASKTGRASSLEDVDMDPDNDLKEALGNAFLVCRVSTYSLLSRLGIFLCCGNRCDKCHESHCHDAFNNASFVRA